MTVSVGFPFWCSNTGLQSTAYSSGLYQSGSSMLRCAGSIYRWRWRRCSLVFCKYHVESI